MVRLVIVQLSRKLNRHTLQRLRAMCDGVEDTQCGGGRTARLVCVAVKVYGNVYSSSRHHVLLYTSWPLYNLAVKTTCKGHRGQG